MKALKHITFLVLMFFRPIAKMLLKIVGSFGILMLISAIALNFMSNRETGWAVGWGIFFSIILGFGSFVLRYYYDSLILRLQPEGENIQLFNI